MALSPLEMARAAAAVDLPPQLSHTLVVLALFFPDIRPTQEQLAMMLKISPRMLNYRLAELERLGRIRRVRGRTGWATTYRINVRKVVSPPSAIADQEQYTSTPTAPDLEPLPF